MNNFTGNLLYINSILNGIIDQFSVAGKARINYMEVENSDSKNKKKESSDGSRSIDLKRGDVYRLEQGTTFYITSYPAPTREKFRIYAVFNIANVDDPRVIIINFVVIEIAFFFNYVEAN